MKLWKSFRGSLLWKMPDPPSGGGTLLGSSSFGLCPVRDKMEKIYSILFYKTNKILKMFISAIECNLLTYINISKTNKLLGKNRNNLLKPIDTQMERYKKSNIAYVFHF